MNKDEILTELSKLKKTYEKEGIVILGLFGSYAQNCQKESSDIDILIETTDAFVAQNDAFEAFEKLEILKQTLSNRFGKPIDLADKKGFKPGSLGEKYILKKALYV